MDFDMDDMDTPDDLDEDISDVREGEDFENIELDNPMYDGLSEADLAILDEVNEEMAQEWNGVLPDFAPDRLPTEATGKFLDEPGDSLFVPNSPEALELLEEMGLDGVEYQGDHPDFNPFANLDTPWGNYLCEVEIPNMTGNRNNPSWEYGRRDSAYDTDTELGNFSQADIALAEQMSRDLETEITPQMIGQFRAEGYTWHETEDLKTMQLLPRIIHNACAHTGGTSIAKTVQAFGNVDIPDDAW